MVRYNDESVLNSIYKNAKSGAQAISDIFGKASDQRFKSDLRTQEHEYNSIASDAAVQLSSFGRSPEPLSPTQKIGMKIGVEMNTLTESNTSHLAELMVKGSNNGILTLTKVLNGYPDPNPQVKSLADRLLTAEHQNLERMKEYLK